MSRRAHGGGELRRALPIVVLPALVLATLYLYVLRPRLATRISTLQANIELAQRDRPHPGIEGESERQLEQLRASIAALESTLPAGAHELTLAAADPGQRAAASERLALLLREHRLELLEELAGGDADNGFPDALRRRLSGESVRSAARTLRFVGRWFDVQALLEALRAEDLTLVPLQLKLARERAQGGAALWTLVVI